MKCPGQDTQFWDKNSIYEEKCPQCETIVEFFKDDNGRRCSKCKTMIRNPKKDLGCLEYCKYAEECMAAIPTSEENDE